MWTLEISHSCIRNGVNGIEYNNYNEFTNYIRHGLHPRTASESMGHGGYENLGGDLHSIRLSGSGRLYFEVDDSAETVTIVQIGGQR